MFPDFLSAPEEAMQAFFPFQWPIRISNESLCELVQAPPRNHAHYGAKLTETFFNEKGEERDEVRIMKFATANPSVGGFDVRGLM
jgi:hypothetical protein